MNPDIGISEKNLKKITDILSYVLADAVILYTKTRKFHWNVKGESFMEYHKLFEAQYTKLDHAIDEIAERVSKLGAFTIGTLQEFLEKGSIKETPGKYPSSTEMLKELMKDHQSVVKTLRGYIDQCEDDLDDKGTADFLTGLMEQHETVAWTLRRYMD